LKARRTRLLVLILALALPAAACGGGESTADTSASTATTQAVASTATAAAPATTAAPAAASTTTPPAATTTAAEDPATGDGTNGIELEITAVNLVFSTNVLNTTAGVRTTVIFTHNDEEAHNFHVRAVDQPLIESKTGDQVTDVFTAIMQPPSSETLTFTIAEPGEYLFFCDTHPLDMTGTLVVNP
jgi:plastocyanin